MKILIGLAACAMGLASGTLLPGYQERDPVPVGADIRPLIIKSCMPCHVDGGSAPFSLDTYQSIQKNRGLIIEQMLKRGMPPKIPITPFGLTSHFAPISDEDLLTVQNWARLPSHFRHDPLLATGSSSSFTRKDNLHQVSISGDVAVEGAPYWMTYVVRVPKGIRNVSAWDATPSFPLAIRSVRLAVVHKTKNLSPKSYRSFGTFEEKLPLRPLGMWVPGHKAWDIGRDFAVSVSEADFFLIQVQYQPIGRAVNGGFRLRLAQSDRPGAKEPVIMRTSQDRFVIPAEKEHQELLRFPITGDCDLHSVLPEARFYATEVKAYVRTKSGERNPLIHFYAWNPLWPSNGMFRSPRPQLRTGDVVELEFSYANDERCSMNEGKTPQPVPAGSKLENEACRASLVLIPR